MGYICTAHPPRRSGCLYVLRLLCSLSLSLGFAHAHAQPALLRDPLYERASFGLAPQAQAQVVTQAEAQLNWCQVVLGDEHPATAQAQARLGLALLQQGNLSLAETTLQKAQKHYEKLGADQQGEEMLKVLAGLSAVLEMQGRWKDAAEVAAQARAQKGNQAVADPPGTLDQDLSLALLYLRAGLADRVAPLLRQHAEDLPLRRGAAGGAELHRGAAVHELWAATLWDMGQWDQAEAEERHVVEALRDEDPKTDEEDLAAAQNNLAVLISRQGRDAEAEPLLSRSLAARARLWGDHDPRTLLSLRNLALVLWRGGQVTRAEAVLHAGEAAVRRGDGGPEMQAQAMALQALLGALYRDEGRDSPAAAARAEGALQKAMTAPGTPGEVAREELAELLSDQGRLDEAAGLLAAILLTRQRDLAAGDPAYLRVLLLTAGVEQKRGRLGTAEHLLRQGVRIIAGPGWEADRGTGRTTLRSPSAAGILLRWQLGELLLRSARGLAQRTRPGEGPLLAGPLFPHTAQPDSARLGTVLLTQALEDLSDYIVQVVPAFGAPDWVQADLQNIGGSVAGALLGRLGRTDLPPEVATALVHALTAPGLAEDLRQELLRLQRSGYLASGAAAAPGAALPPATQAPPAAADLQAAQAATDLLALWRQRASLWLDPPGPAGPPGALHASKDGNADAGTGQDAVAARLLRLVPLIEAAERDVAARSPRFRRLLRARDRDAASLDRLLAGSGGPLVLLQRAPLPASPALPPATFTAPPRPQPHLTLSRAGRPLPPLRLARIAPPEGPAPAARLHRPADADHYLGLVLGGPRAQLIDLGEAAAIDTAAEHLAPQAEAGKDILPMLAELGRLLLDPLFPALLVGRGDIGAEADRLALQPVGDDALEAREGAAADEQDVGRIDLQEFLLGMLAPALRRHGGDCAFHDLQQGLLHAFA